MHLTLKIFLLFKLLECPDDDLDKFMDGSERYYLCDLLTTAGFPYIEIMSSNKRMAYKCILTHKVVTKSVVVLDDLRKGLTAVTYQRTSLADLANEHISHQKTGLSCQGQPDQRRRANATCGI